MSVGSLPTAGAGEVGSGTQQSWRKDRGCSLYISVGAGRADCSHSTLQFSGVGGHSLQQLSQSLQLTRGSGFSVALQLVVEDPVVEGLVEAVGRRPNGRGFGGGCWCFAAHSPRRTSSVQPLSGQGNSLTQVCWLSPCQFSAGSSCFSASFASKFAEGLVEWCRLTGAWSLVPARRPLLSCRCFTSG